MQFLINLSSLLLVAVSSISSVQLQSVQFNCNRFSSIAIGSVQFSVVQLQSVQFSVVQLQSVQFSVVQLQSVQFDVWSLADKFDNEVRQNSLGWFLLVRPPESDCLL